MKLKSSGLTLVAAVLAVPLIWVVPLSAVHGAQPMIAQYLGMIALLAMSMDQLIATRISLVEKIFGGLDRSYILHKWLGIGAVVAMFLHDQIDAEIDSFGRGDSWNQLGEELGEIGYYGLLVLVAITVATFIPYHLWRWTHKLIGAFFALCATHYFLVQKPFSNFDILGLYVGIFCLAGILAYLYSLLPARQLSAKQYKVAAIGHSGDALEISLAPQGAPLRHRAGQFAFISFDQDGLKENHPFTISKAPTEDGSLRFTTKPLGDFTSALARDLKSGTSVSVTGPHGRFTSFPSLNSQIWIAAGIGITPFAAWAQGLGDSGPTVHLFFTVRKLEQAAHLDELQATAQRLPNFHLHLIETDSGPRLDAARIEAELGDNLKSAQAYYCGPKGLRDALKTDLAKLGLPARRFHFEEFEIRTGIGISRLIKRLKKQ